MSEKEMATKPQVTKENLIERNILLNGKKIEKNNIFIGDDMLDKTNKISIEIVE